jgi:hypothetical protein
MIKNHEILDKLLPLEKTFCGVMLDMKWKEKIAILSVIRIIEDRIEYLNTADYNQFQMNVFAFLILQYYNKLMNINRHIKVLEKRI